MWGYAQTRCRVYRRILMGVPVSFLSDFGLQDEFVGVVHGVLSKVSPDSRIIDLGHNFPRGDIRSSALALMRAIQYLPEGVCLAVVDPGVGTDRKAIAAETPWGFFVGPDNGLLTPAVRMVGGASRVVAIENPEAMIPSPGQTFHGRDIFAPAAGLLAAGEVDLTDLGPEVPGDQIVPLLLPLTETNNGTVVGEVWWVDQFGNAQTNVSPEDLEAVGIEPGGFVTVKVGSAIHSVRWLTAYGDVAEGESLLHVDSSGLIALAVRDGSAVEDLKVFDGVAVSFMANRAATAG